MSERDPKRPSRLSPSEARAVRMWIVSLLGASTLMVAMAPYTDAATDRVIAIIAAAVFITGAVQMRRPAGLRVILSGSGVIALLVALGLLHG